MNLGICVKKCYDQWKQYHRLGTLVMYQMQSIHQLRICYPITYSRECIACIQFTIGMVVSWYCVKAVEYMLFCAVLCVCTVDHWTQEFFKASGVPSMEKRGGGSASQSNHHHNIVHLQSCTKSFLTCLFWTASHKISLSSAVPAGL